MKSAWYSDPTRFELISYLDGMNIWTMEIKHYADDLDSILPTKIQKDSWNSWQIFSFQTILPELQHCVLLKNYWKFQSEICPLK